MDYNTRAWFESLAQYRPPNERALWAVFALLGRPASYLDLGCGDGWMVRTARMAGAKPALGIDISGACYQGGHKWAKMLTMDLTEPIQLRNTFDLVTCIEVAEHVAPSGSETLCDNIAKHATRWVVFTAAPEGQNGDGHINCQPQEYWRALLQERGLVFMEHETARLREIWTHTTGSMFWLPQNVQVFKR